MTRLSITLLCALAMIGCAVEVFAGPNYSELVGYKCLVPDWWKSYGGIDPALSPDGKRLAFRTYDCTTPYSAWEEQVWIMPHVETPLSLADGEYRLTPPLASEDELGIHDDPVSTTDRRNQLQWSPDGKQLVFVLRGRMFLAEDFNDATKTAKIRMIADVRTVSKEEIERETKRKSYPQPKLAIPIADVRWSPDGTKIAFLRRKGWLTRLGDLCVLDVQSGKENVVAEDADFQESMTSQPWSPDSKCLVYKDFVMTPAWSCRVVSVETGESRVLPGHHSRASWSPTGNWLIAQTLYQSNGTVRIMTSEGKENRVFGRGKSEYLLKTEEDEALSKMKLVVKGNFGAHLSPVLIKWVDTSCDSLSVLYRCICIGQARVATKGLGKEIAQKIDEQEKVLINELPKLKDPGYKPKSLRDIVTKIDGVLPKEQKKQLVDQRNALYDSSVPRIGYSDYGFVWSGDGKSVALIRGLYTINPLTFHSQELRVVDVATGKERILLTTDRIISVSWTCNDKVMVVETKRDMATQRYQESVGRGSSGPWGILPGYSEIWMLKLQEPGNLYNPAPDRDYYNTIVPPRDYFKQ